MASKELIEKVENIVFEAMLHGSHPRNVAEAAISTILAALQEPTEEMLEECSDAWRYGQVLWPKMLAASALGEQSE